MNRALIIGCAAYEDADIAPLRYSHRDAARLAEVMRATCDVAEHDLVVMHDEMPDPYRPTRTNILRQLTAISKNPQEDGTTYFFFSGHGFQGGDNEQYLLPIDCVRDAIEETALRFNSVVRYLGSAASPHLVLLLDACRNVVAGGKAVESTLERVDIHALCPPGIVSFCSCVPGAVSYESDAIEAGIFTEALCQALSPDGRCKTIYELDTYLTANVPVLARLNGKPTQIAHSRVEPLGIQTLQIVSDRIRNEWLSETPLGSERRTRKAPLSVPGGSVTNPLIGVDFGTAYSVISWTNSDEEIQLLPGGDGRQLVPSLVHFLPDMDYLVGSAALDADPYNPVNTIRYVKRMLGTSTTYNIGGRSIEPELAASLILRSLRRNAEEALGTSVSRCIASHPAHFTLRQVRALEKAFRLAGFTIIRMVGEPNIAAHLTYNTGQTPGQDVSCLVIDLGGGTFDVALVDAGEGVAEVKSSFGSNKVGGLDYDVAVAHYAEEQLRNEHGWTGPLSADLREKLRREADRAKRDLGRRETTTLLLQDIEDGARGLADISIELDRARFREITAELNSQIRSTIIAAFERLEFGEKIRDWLGSGGVVLLAGQGTKIFTVREQIEEVLPGVRIISNYQETAVAQGLGMQTAVLSGMLKDVLLLNSLQFGIGFGVFRHGEKISPVLADNKDEQFSCILSPSTTIPTKRSEVIDLEPGVISDIVVTEWPVLDGEVFGRIPIMTNGGRIELGVDVDAGSSVEITVKDLGTGKMDRYRLEQLPESS
jgi:molecular chaperone DnaK (HSP70)